VSRARGSTTFPARFILVGPMNPCPCGEGGFPGACRCPESARERYFRRLSAPLLDRFDIAVRIERPDVDELFGEHPPESTSTVSARVAGARRWAVERSGCINSELTGRELDRVAPMSRAAASLLERRVRSGALSARGLDRVRRLARTVADLETLATEAGVSGMRSGAAGADNSAVGAGDGVTSNGGGADSADVGVIEVEHLQQALLLRSQREYLLGSAQ
jgi:magnesium chelatase family protein